jgi:fucose 4-O-acetylase-like acetyltransferase
MLPYLFVGYFCKNHMDVYNRWITPLAIFGIISIVGQFILSLCVDFYTIPTHDANISINRTFYIHIVNAVTGSAFVLWLSKKISCNHFIETLGKGTLLIYLWNGLVNRLLLHILLPPNTESIILTILFHASIFILMLIIFYVLIRIVYETKYLRWIVGKW